MLVCNCLQLGQATGAHYTGVQRSISGLTLLVSFASQCWVQVVLIERVLELGASPSTVNRYGRAAIFYVADMPLAEKDWPSLDQKLGKLATQRRAHLEVELRVETDPSAECASLRQGSSDKQARNPLDWLRKWIRDDSEYGGRSLIMEDYPEALPWLAPSGKLAPHTRKWATACEKMISLLELREPIALRLGDRTASK